MANLQKIMLVSRSIKILEYLKNLLQIDYELDIPLPVTESLNMIKRGSYDLVICDASPGDSYEADPRIINEIVELCSESEQEMIVLVDKLDEQKLLKRETIHLLKKPFTVNELLMMIEQALRQAF